MLYTCILIVCMGALCMYIDYVYGCYACILMVYMGARYMYVDCVYGFYIHVYWLRIWVLCTCILIVYMGAIYMYIDCIHVCYLRVYWWCICNKILFRPEICSAGTYFTENLLCRNFLNETLVPGTYFMGKFIPLMWNLFWYLFHDQQWNLFRNEHYKNNY